MTLALFLLICFMAYVCFVNSNHSEGFTDKGGNKKGSGSRAGAGSGSGAGSGAGSGSGAGAGAGSNGIAGNASTYAANLKAASVKLADTLLITKYRSDYESAIMNAEDLIHNLMLEITLNINPQDPHESIAKLVALHHAEAALIGVMKFVDSS